MARGIVLGTAGHVDHGKTALVRALTGVDTDRWREEKERGLTIDIGFARLTADEGMEIGVVDVPGHEDFLKNMLAGATGLDLLLLVVAADEGPMPQTREHLAIASLLGIDRGVVALSKSDRVDREWLELALEATREELQRVLGRADWPMVPVSSLTGEGIEELRRRIRNAAGSGTSRPADDLFRLPVDRSFSVHGTGTVVTGTVWSGKVALGDELRLLPAEATVRVRSLQVHGEARSEVPAGRRCALALVGADPQETGRGTVAVADGPWRPERRLGVRIRMLPHAARSLEDGQRLRVFHGTREVMGRVQIAGRRTLPAGKAGWGLLRLEQPLVPRVRDRLVLRFYSPVTTIGGAQVAELRPPARWAGRNREWERVLDGDLADAVTAAVALAGPTGLPRQRLPLVTGIPTGALISLEDGPPPRLLLAGGRWFDRQDLEEAEASLLQELKRIHRTRPRAMAASLSALRSTGGGRFARPLVELALNRLSDRGAVLVEGPSVRLPDHRPMLDEQEETIRGELLSVLRTGGAEPPTVGELERRFQGQRALLHDLLHLLAAESEVVALSPDIYVTRPVAEQLERNARRVLTEMTVAPPTAFKDAFGVSRKYLIPILEWLDQAGVTRRTGEGRELAEHRQENG